MYPTGRCSLGEDCRCPEGQLRPKYSCIYCKVQLHSFVQGCAEAADEDGAVECLPQFGCKRKRAAQPNSTVVRETTAPAPSPEPALIARASISRVSNAAAAAGAEATMVEPASQRSKMKKGVVPGKKRGIKAGSKVKIKSNQKSWYVACKQLRDLQASQKAAGKTVMTNAAFLRSDLSGDSFTDSRSQQVSFARKLKEFDSGKLQPSSLLRNRSKKYERIEQKLIEYLGTQAYSRHKRGVSWLILQEKCLEWAKLLGLDDTFKCSPGWLSKTIKRYNRVGTNLHGEAGDLSPEEKEALMGQSMTTPWDQIAEDSYRNWLMDTPMSAEEFNRASLIERRNLRTLYQQQRCTGFNNVAL